MAIHLRKNDGIIQIVRHQFVHQSPLIARFVLVIAHAHYYDFRVMTQAGEVFIAICPVLQNKKFKVCFDQRDKRNGIVWEDGIGLHTCQQTLFFSLHIGIVVDDIPPLRVELLRQLRAYIQIIGGKVGIGNDMNFIFIHPVADNNRYIFAANAAHRRRFSPFRRKIIEALCRFCGNG